MVFTKGTMSFMKIIIYTPCTLCILCALCGYLLLTTKFAKIIKKSSKYLYYLILVYFVRSSCSLWLNVFYDTEVIYFLTTKFYPCALCVLRALSG